MAASPLALPSSFECAGRSARFTWERAFGLERVQVPRTARSDPRGATGLDLCPPWFWDDRPKGRRRRRKAEIGVRVPVVPPHRGSSGPLRRGYRLHQPGFLAQLGEHRADTAEMGVRVPFLARFFVRLEPLQSLARSTKKRSGVIVQREDAALAKQRSGFESPPLLRGSGRSARVTFEQFPLAANLVRPPTATRPLSRFSGEDLGLQPRVPGFDSQAALPHCMQSVPIR